MSQAVPLDPPRRLLDLEVDGETVRVPEGSTILDACRAQGIDTPTLCYAENLTPVNACRVCVVEVEGSRMLVPACSRKAEAGMVVKTDTERVRTPASWCWSSWPRPSTRAHEPRRPPVDGGVRGRPRPVRRADGAAPGGRARRALGRAITTSRRIRPSRRPSPSP